MPSINLGDHFEKFVQERIARGRYQNASEVVRAGLRLLEEHEMALEERAVQLKAKINEAWDDPRPSRPADDVFDRIEAEHAKTAQNTLG
jgi:antitoxin ParD1/3/4